MSGNYAAQAYPNIVAAVRQVLANAEVEGCTFERLARPTDAASVASPGAMFLVSEHARRSDEGRRAGHQIPCGCPALGCRALTCRITINRRGRNQQSAGVARSCAINSRAIGSVRRELRHRSATWRRSPATSPADVRCFRDVRVVQPPTADPLRRARRFNRGHALKRATIALPHHPTCVAILSSCRDLHDGRWHRVPSFATSTRRTPHAEVVLNTAN
jgi:hypothetical protein